MEQKELTFCLKCDKCNKQNQCYCSDLEWEEADKNEKGMGPETLHVATWGITCDCSNNMEIEFMCWEYPVGVAEDTDFEIKGAKLLDCDCRCPNFHPEINDEIYSEL